MTRNRRPSGPALAHPASAGFRLPPDVILLAVRWYLRYVLSYRDLEELLAERGIDVDHVTLFRWAQPFTPELIDAARPSRHAVGDRWFVDETYVKVNGVWRHVYRAVYQHGQAIDVIVSKQRDIASATRFLSTALAAHRASAELITDQAAALASEIEELIPAAFHNTRQYENNQCECDHGRLKARLRPMRGLKTDRTASVAIRGHAFIQNLRRGHDEFDVEASRVFRLAPAFDELRLAIRMMPPHRTFPHALRWPDATPPFEVAVAVTGGLQQHVLARNPLHPLAVHRLTELTRRERGDQPGAVDRVRLCDLDDPLVTGAPSTGTRSLEGHHVRSHRPRRSQDRKATHNVAMSAVRVALSPVSCSTLRIR
jgi:transposase-like protein